MIYKNKPYLCDMKTSKDYIAEDFTATIPVADYMAHYRDAEKFIGFCRQCRRYNTCWACPPFAFDVDQYLSHYELALIIGTKITPSYPEKITDTISYGNELMETERKRTDDLLLELEKTHNGRAFFPGSCLLCSSCTRAEGKPCLYPKRVRPSLEACGFDIGKTSSELLNRVEMGRAWENAGVSNTGQWNILHSERACQSQYCLLNISIILILNWQSNNCKF